MAVLGRPANAAVSAVDLSGMMPPLEEGPGWTKAVSAFNPLTYIVETERAVFAGDYTFADIWPGLTAVGVTAAVGLSVGIAAARAKSRWWEKGDVGGGTRGAFGATSHPGRRLYSCLPVPLSSICFCRVIPVRSRRSVPM